MIKNRKFKFINGRYVYIVCSNFGAYMEPDVEIVKVFLNYRLAKHYVDYYNHKYYNRCFSEPYFLLRKRVVLNE